MIAVSGRTQGVLPANGSVDQLDPAVVQDRRHDAVVELLRSAVNRPMLVIVEDLHWADEASLSLLRRLAIATERSPWLLVATARPGSAALGDAAHERRVLEPLAGEGLGALAARLALDANLLDSDVARLVERSGGNPLFLTELITAGRTDELPDTIEQLLAARIDALPAWDRALLRDVAVLGSTVELDLAAEVCEDIEVARPDRWSSLSAFVSIGETSLRFRHDLMRSVAYEGLAKRRRRDLHGRAADALAGKADDTTRAVHLLRAERWADAWPVAARAATTARAQGALADAADLYAQAAAATRRAQPAALDASFELDAEHADALELLGRFPEAEMVLRRVARTGPLAPRDRARLARQTARVQRRIGRFAAALAWVTRG